MVTDDPPTGELECHTAAIDIVFSQSEAFGIFLQDGVPMLRPEAELRQELDANGVSLTAPLVASCGSGLSACVLALSAYVNGKPDVAVYDVCAPLRGAPISHENAIAHAICGMHRGNSCPGVARVHNHAYLFVFRVRGRNGRWTPRHRSCSHPYLNNRLVHQRLAKVP